MSRVLSSRRCFVGALHISGCKLLSCVRRCRFCASFVRRLQIEADTAHALKEKVDVLQAQDKERARAEALAARLRNQLEAVSATADLAKELQDSNKQLNTRVIELESKAAQVPDLEEELGEARQARCVAELALSEAEAGAEAARGEAQELRAALEAREEALMRVEAEAAALREADAGTSGTAAAVGGSVSEYNPQVAEMLVRLQSENKRLLSAVEATGEDNVKELTRQLKHATLMGDTAKEQLRAKKAEAGQLAAELEATTEALREAKAEGTAQETRAEMLEARLTAAKSRNQELQGSMEHTSEQLAAALASVERLEGALRTEQANRDEAARAAREEATKTADAHAAATLALTAEFDARLEKLQAEKERVEATWTQGMLEAQEAMNVAQERTDAERAATAAELSKLAEELAAHKHQSAVDVARREAGAAQLQAELEAERTRGSKLLAELRKARAELEAVQGELEDRELQLSRLKRDMQRVRDESCRQGWKKGPDAGQSVALEEATSLCNRLQGDLILANNHIEELQLAMKLAGVAPGILRGSEDRAGPHPSAAGAAPADAGVMAGKARRVGLRGPAQAVGAEDRTDAFTTAMALRDAQIRELKEQVQQQQTLMSEQARERTGIAQRSEELEKGVYELKSALNSMQLQRERVIEASKGMPDEIRCRLVKAVTTGSSAHSKVLEAATASALPSARPVRRMIAVEGKAEEGSRGESSAGAQTALPADSAGAVTSPAVASGTEQQAGSRRQERSSHRGMHNISAFEDSDSDDDHDDAQYKAAADALADVPTARVGEPVAKRAARPALRRLATKSTNAGEGVRLSLYSKPKTVKRTSSRLHSK